MHSNRSLVGTGRRDRNRWVTVRQADLAGQEALLRRQDLPLQDSYHHNLGEASTAGREGRGWVPDRLLGGGRLVLLEVWEGAWEGLPPPLRWEEEWAEGWVEGWEEGCLG